MWEAMMMLRQLASLGSPLSIRPGAKASQRILSTQVLTGAIRLSFAAYRLSLPIASLNVKNDDRKIA
ncbi:hypothetical protein EN817_27850 [Mesorhizobium sp. M3A.F.Ca.ET.174.01.1.1]|nr:hypothetical protein EN844_00375 [Mesorhizobium sp. M3A.F.Ca.ET.201.01.1.1]TGS82439.1 hypothetical protein EN818_27300 [Mesorhizobium sp. M3A.F.Ca.ET.175.01.1.1]TGT22261.1 hypothetical protein EN817_27850 [Mesorhizobium sp. M3A.F.Ca.ET.174.01.1.1]